MLRLALYIYPGFSGRSLGSCGHEEEKGWKRRKGGKGGRKRREGGRIDGLMDGWIKETLLQFSETFFVSCTGVVLQESVQSQSSMASNEISEVRVYV